MRKIYGSVIPLIIVFLFLSIAGRAQVEYKLISFSDVKPEGFPLQFCWNSLGIDPDDNVYIAFGNNNEWPGHDDDVALFSYNDESGVKRFLDTYNNVLDKAENRIAGEVVCKGHTDILYMDGRMYIGTQPNPNPNVDLDDFRGSHLLAYDIVMDSIIDLSKNLPGGVIQENRGILGLTSIPELHYIVGYGNPFGDLIYYNTLSGTVDRIVPGQRVNNNISRNLIPTAEGDIYYSWGWERVYRYDYENDITIRTTYQGGKPFWNGLAMTADRSVAYISDPEATVYKLVIETGELTALGSINPYGGGITSIILSLDESKLYTIPAVKPYRLIEMDLATSEVSGVYEFPSGFGDGSYTFTGNNVKDSKGHLYFARHELKSGNVDGIYDGKLLIVDVGQGLRANNSPEFTMDTEFTTHVSLVPDTIFITNISDGDGGIQNLSLSADKGDIRSITTPVCTFSANRTDAWISFLPRETGSLDLKVTLSDDGTGTAGGGLSIAKTIEINILPAVSVPGIEKLSPELYPIPANEFLIIDMKESRYKSIRIYDVMGKLLGQVSCGTAGGKIEYDTSHLADGIYFVEFVGEKAKGKVVKSFFVKKTI